MEEGVKKFRCGACGHDKYELYKKEENEKMVILVECMKCNSISEIRVTQPELTIEWGHPSEGIICIF